MAARRTCEGISAMSARALCLSAWPLVSSRHSCSRLLSPALSSSCLPAAACCVHRFRVMMKTTTTMMMMQGGGHVCVGVCVGGPPLPFCSPLCMKSKLCTQKKIEKKKKDILISNVELNRDMYRHLLTCGGGLTIWQR